jgi:hypothetical protein
MREGASRDPSGQNRVRNEKNKALDIDFKSYTHMKAVGTRLSYYPSRFIKNSHCSELFNF